MTYKKTDAKPDFPKMEHEILSFWKSDDTFQKTLVATKDGEPFSFYDGPPFANGLPHWGHLGVSVVKDMVCRFQTMRGRYVNRELGWDCHGLPAENSVEKKQGKTAAKIVGEVGIDGFCDMCRTDVLVYTNEWLSFIERMGRWVRGGNDFGYRTMDLNFMESMLWTIKELYDRGLLYKDYRVNPYDWKNGTVLSNSEASSDYRDVVDDAITVWFELANGRRILAWTTTPWTLPANSALAVNPKMTYAIMRDADNIEYIIAESRLSAFEKQFADCVCVGTLIGAEIIGLKYTPLFNYYSNEKLYSVIGADYVSDSSGTGIVHIAPAFGEEDFWAAKNIDPDFPIILNIDNYGNFDETVIDFAGLNIFDANSKIIEMLKKTGNLVKKEQYKHSYPYGDRSKEKLIYRATDSWYINVPKIRDKLLANNELVNWTTAGERFRAWIENARPWSISRNRFWGTPLPIWTNESGEIKVFGGIAEINEFFNADVRDLHRPTLDALTRDGWTRIPDVMDCWVESGSMPWASLHYPFENKSEFEKTFPADYIIEGQDQTRGWFYSLMVLATALFDKPAFMNVSANGMIVDENKKKFSKSLGNFVNPGAQIEQFGADAVRLYILGSNFMKAEPVPTDKEGRVFAEPIKSILTPLWNSYHFFTLYANAGNITATEITDFENVPNIMDRYILLELNELFKVCGESLASYQPDVALRKITEFLDILNNWYVRRNRARFWDEDVAAFNTLYTVIVCLCRTLAPFAPFASEYIYRELLDGASVHLSKYPTYLITKTGAELSEKMRRVMMVVSTGKQLRENYKLRNRLPLSGITIAGADMSEFSDIIRDELNVKSVEFISDVSSVADNFIYLITPKIGARLGPLLREIIPAVKNGNYTEKAGILTVNGHVLLADEFETHLTVRSGITGAALPDNTAVVVLDTRLSPELIATGLANDVLRFIQDTRKTMDLNVSERITLLYNGDAEIIDAIKSHQNRIMSDALILEMGIGAGDYKTQIEGHDLEISMSRML